MKTQSTDMTKGSIYPKIFLFTIPVILTGVMQVLYNACDMVVVGKFSGETSLAAVGSTSSATNLLVNVFMGMSTAASVIIARKFGAKNKNGVSKAVHSAVALCIISGILLSILGVIFSRKILVWMNSPKEVIDLSTLYMQIYFLGITSTLIYNFGSAILRAIGDSKRPMYYLILSGVLNVILNIFFVAALHMDVVGVALATIISQTVAAVLVLRNLMKTNECYKLIWKKVKIYKNDLIEILYLGIPAGIQGSVFSVSNMMIQSSINSVGPVAMAGNAAGQSIEGIVYCSMNAFYQSVLTFISQNFGARNFSRIKKGLRAGYILVTLTGICVGGVTLLFAENLVGLYSNDAEVIQSGVMRINYIVSLYFLCGLMDVGSAGLRGLSTSILPTSLTIIGVCGIRMVMIVMGRPYRVMDDLIILYVSYWVSWIVTALLNFIAFEIVKNKKMKEEALCVE